MRVRRFADFAKTLLEEAAPPAVRSIQTFAEAGYTAKPRGLLITFATGARVYMQFVGSGGGSYDEPEQIVEGAPPEPVPVPELILQRGKLRLQDFELYMRALLLDSDSKEIREVEAFSPREKPGYHRYGLGVHFHGGADVTAMFVHTLPAGATARREGEYKTLELV